MGLANDQPHFKTGSEKIILRNHLNTSFNEVR
jgi:hypothetical protein